MSPHRIAAASEPLSRPFRINCRNARSSVSAQAVGSRDKSGNVDDGDHGEQQGDDVPEDRVDSILPRFDHLVGLYQAAHDGASYDHGHDDGYQGEDGRHDYGAYIGRSLAVGPPRK